MGMRGWRSVKNLESLDPLRITCCTKRLGSPSPVHSICSWRGGGGVLLGGVNLITSSLYTYMCIDDRWMKLVDRKSSSHLH